MHVKVGCDNSLLKNRKKESGLIECKIGKTNCHACSSTLITFIVAVPFVLKAHPLSRYFGFLLQ